MEEEYLLIYYNDGLKTINLSGEVKNHRNETKKFIEDYCIKNGSTLEGRNVAFRMLTHTKCKPCLVVSNQKGLYYLTTRSIKDNQELYLINYLELDKIKQSDNHHTILFFKNGYQCKINVNYRIIKRQIKLMQIYLCSISFKLYKCYNL